MPGVLFIFLTTFALLLVPIGMFCAYHVGKWAERKQVWKWLRFVHDEIDWRDIDPLHLADMIVAGQHHDYEENP